MSERDTLRERLLRLADTIDSYCDHEDDDPTCLDSLHALSAQVRDEALAATPAPSVQHDDWCDGSGSSAGSACCRLAATPAPALDAERIAARVVAVIERIVTDQALNTPLNREALISAVRAAAYAKDKP